MGCDIHAFVEYKRKSSESWSGLGDQLSLDRNYSIFSFMCTGARYENEKGYKAKGLPIDLAYYSRDANWLYITEDKDEPNTATLAEATQWHREGKGSVIKYGSDNKPQYVEHPDWHSHSWLTTAEFEICVNSASYVSVDYKAILACMKSLEENECNARIVFWFDN